MSDEMITVTLRRDDALAVALGPLDYAVEHPGEGGSPMRLRQDLMAALQRLAEDVRPVERRHGERRQEASVRGGDFKTPVRRSGIDRRKL